MKKLKLFFWVLAVLVMCGVSMIPSVKFTGYADKAAHFAVYSLLMVLPMLTFDRRWAMVASAFFLLAMSGVIEIMQHYTPGREGSAADFAANAAGLLMGALIGYLIRSGMRPSR